jgi:intracellular sulfur oxidation DsrE/DsrF family protein
MSQHDQPTDRRRFLTTVAGSAAALAAAGTFGAGELLAQARSFPQYEPPQGGWDLAWAEHVEKAKHKVVFDWVSISDGMALNNALVYMNGFKEVYRSADADLGVVIVARHAGLPTVLNDEMWATLKLGEKNKLKDPTTGEPATRNPFVNYKPGDKFLTGFPEGGMDALLARGVHVLCCNLALMRFAGTLARETGMSVPDAQTKIAASLVPGVVRQPSGIFAVARAQEAGAQFIRSTE